MQIPALFSSVCCTDEAFGHLASPVSADLIICAARLAQYRVHPVICHRADHYRKPVSNQFFRNFVGMTAIQTGSHECYFMWRSTSNGYSDRNTIAVRNCHDLGPFSSLCFTNARAPFLAEANDPSINASLTSIFPRSRRSETNAARIFPIRRPLSIPDNVDDTFDKVDTV